MTTPPADIRDCLCLHTRRAARLLTQHYDEQLRPSGLKVTQFTILAALEHMQPAAQQPLADFLGMDRTTLTRNLAVLGREGRIAVGRDKGDARTNRIRLTAAGERALREAEPLWAKAHAGATDQLASAGTEPNAVREMLGRLGKLG